MILKSAKAMALAASFLSVLSAEASARYIQRTMRKTVADFQEVFGQYKPAGKTFVVLSGCTNGPHRLTFAPSVPSRRPCLGKLIVHKPFGKEPGETADEIKAAAHRAPVNPEFKLNGI